MSITELDNPIWHSLNAAHKDFSIGGDLAKRYQPDVLGASAIKEYTKEAYKQLAALFEPQDGTALVNAINLNTDEWERLEQFSARKMICIQTMPAPKYDLEIHPLTTQNALEMMALVELTQPGPFWKRTVEVGSYLGIREDKQLVAMAGSRMFTPHYREISAVCTHPDYRGKGYASILVQLLAHQFQQDGITPFLHVAHDNHAAQSVYKKLGFEFHQDTDFTIIRRCGND